MLFGGSAGETGELGRAVMRVPAKRVIDTTLKIIELYKKERSAAATAAIAGGDPQDGDKEQQQQQQQLQQQHEQHNHETLHQWIIRLVKSQGSGSIKNIEDMKAALAEVIQLPSSQQNPDVYRDYGSDTHFTAKTARGECAA
jgi:sulfite reductase (ferredoxin)